MRFVNHRRKCSCRNLLLKKNCRLQVYSFCKKPALQGVTLWNFQNTQSSYIYKTSLDESTYYLQLIIYYYTKKPCFIIPFLWLSFGIKRAKEAFLFNTNRSDARTNNKCRCSKPTFEEIYTNRLYFRKAKVDRVPII